MGLGDTPDAAEQTFFVPLKLKQLDIHRIVKVAAGSFSAALTDQNQLIVWGSG